MICRICQCIAGAEYAGRGDFNVISTATGNALICECITTSTGNDWRECGRTVAANVWAGNHVRIDRLMAEHCDLIHPLTPTEGLCLSCDRDLTDEYEQFMRHEAQADRYQTDADLRHAQ